MGLYSYFPALAILVISTQVFAGLRTDHDERTVARICAVKAPVLVIDTFAGHASNEINIDIDGDGSYDVHHGDFVAKLIELNGQQTLKLVIPTPVFSPKLLEVLTETADKIEQGFLRIAWINFSQGFTVEIDSLNGLLGQRNLVNERNVHDYGRRVLEKLWTSKPKLMLRELNEAFLRLERLGVPVVVAAANSGYREVNLYSLFPNVISVGAIDLAGKKASYSADNSAVTVWRRGDVLSYAVAGGADLNGDGLMDLPIITPAVPKAVLEMLVGKHAPTLAKQVPADIDAANDEGHATFFELTAKLPQGVYSTNEILRKTLGTGFQNSRYIQSLGDYFYLDGEHPRPLLYMKIDSSGRILLRQGTIEGHGVFRNVLYGTSFASPNICDGTKTPERFAQ